MTTAIRAFLKQNDLTIRRISRTSGISASTLSSTFKRPINSWSIGILNNLANITHSIPTRVLQDLQTNQWKLEINSRQQTIQGVKITPKVVFQRLRFIVMNEYFEGWKPNHNDIKMLLRSNQKPNQLVKKTIHKYLREAHHA